MIRIVGVTLSICNIQDNYLLHIDTLLSQNSNFSVAMITDLIKCNCRLRKTNKSYMRIFSVGLDLACSNVLKEIFVLGTSISTNFECIV